MLPKHHKTSFFLNTGLFDNLLNFAELEDRISKLPTTVDIGDAFEVFAEAYFFTQKIEQVEEVWPFKSIPFRIKQDLSLGTNQKDMGVDGAFRTTSGTFNAYQAKFRTGRTSLTWGELSTFMGLTDNVSQRVLFTNSNDITSVINERTGFHCVRGNDLDRLEKSDFEAILKWLQSGEVKVERKTPLHHQDEAIKDILNTLKAEDRATALMACGTGKTLVALWVSEQMDCQNILVLLPSLTLVRQSLHEWLRETEWQHLSYLCVCSDPTVASKDLDSIAINQSDLDFAVTTESNNVKQFFSQNTKGVKILFSTYQSTHIVAEGMDSNFRFDLGIFDEAHKTAGREGSKFSFALKDDNLRINKRLFLTATPRHYNLNKRNEDGDFDLVYSMDNSDIYGKVAHQLSFAKAARQDIICNYKVIISVVTSEQVSKELLKKGEVLIDGDVVNAQQVANQIAFKEAVGKYNIRRIFTFHRSVAEAKLFTEKGSEGICTQLPDFNAFHVNGKMSTAVRERIMHEFKDSDLSVISNARCLTEGVDLPAVDMVAFMSPKKSKVDIIQATGRAMRKDPHNPDKILGYILVPLYLEITTDESVEGAVEKADFGEIWNVLQALQEQDDVLTDIIRQMQEDKGKYGKPKSSKLGDKVETIGIDISLETLKESITALSIEKLGFAWDLRYGELIKYKDQFGDCNIPSNWGENQQLVNWVRTQRTNYKNKQLSKDQVKRLENIGFAWDPIWEKMFDTLKEYKKNHGDCNVVCNRQEDNKLVDWVNRQRMFYLTKKLSDERIKRLECIDFVWDPVWEEMFDTLKEYKKNHGDTNVPSKWPEDKKLANWVYRQRGFYLDQQLSKDQVKRLENIGFVWDPIWEEMFDTLKEYKNVYGDCNVPSKWPENEKFATWVYIQHHRYRIGLLGVNRIKRLEEMGFLWGQFERIWEEMFNALREYKKNHGDCNVPQNWEEYKLKLGQWVRHQRLSYRIRKLSDGQIKCLEDIGFVWDPIWEKMFKILKEYEKNHGNCNVFENNQKDEKLAIWANTQRRMYKKGELNCDHIKRLEGIGFVWEKTDLFYSEGWEDGDQKRWSEIFDVLKEYKNVYGDCNVPSQWPEDVELASWVYIQRALYRNKTLSNECIKHLEGINFTWDPIFVLDPIWEETLYDLKEYRRNYGDCNVPKNWTDQQLANWVETQRQSYQIGELDYNRIRRLERIDFVWDPLEVVWQKMLYKLKEHKKYHGDCNVPKHWTDQQLANWVETQRQSYQIGELDYNRIRCLERINFVWDPLEAAWQKMLYKLKEYKKYHGDCNVPKHWTENKQLANWVDAQRIKYCSQELSDDCLNQLEDIDFDWTPPLEETKEKRLREDHIQHLEDIGFNWDKHKINWQERFAKLKEYKEVHGTCNVPTDWPDRKLVNWVNTQRTKYKEEKLRDDHIQHLEEIGFEWNKNKINWQERFTKLKEYKEVHGTCNVPTDWPDRKLVNWVNTQRTKYKKGELSYGHIKRLDEISFEWPFSVKKIDNERDEETRKKKPHRLLSKDGAESWKDMFDTLKEYKKEHGDCNISFSWNKQLATWVSAQRSNYRRRKLRDDRIKLLDDIGFEWASSVKKKDEEIWESRWKEKFDLLKEYKKEYGDCNVQRDWRDRQLVNWMVSQRTRYRNKKLNEERIKLLEEIGFEWNPYNG